MNIIIPQTIDKIGGKRESKIKYPIKIRTDYRNLNAKPHSKIFVCIYKINKKTDKKFIHKPFLQYLIYKYKDPKNICVFPFKKYKRGITPLNTANNLVNETIQNNSKCLGFLSWRDNHYFFYKSDQNLSNVQQCDKNNELWWCNIDEICNKKKLINFHIHESCYRIFYENPSLIYIYRNKQKIEIPVVAYYGDTFQLISYISSVGLRANSLRMFGPYFYFTSFKKAIAWGSWTSNYKPRFIDKKKITDNNGKYNKGGIIRYTLFLDKSRVVLYDKKDPIYKTIYTFDNIDKKDSGKFQKMQNWTKNYNSLILGNIKYKKLSGYFNINTEYVVKKFSQQIPMTTHVVDKKLLKVNWDPNYDFYSIE